MFGFDAFDLQEYKVGVGGKYWLDSRHAVAISVDVDNNKNQTTTAPSGSNEFDLLSYSGSIGLERHFGKGPARISPYIGAEFNVTRQQRSTSQNPSYENKRRYTRYGIYGLLGVEYAFTEQLSVAAEYFFGYAYTEAYNDTVSSGIIISSSKTTISDLQASSNMLMLMFYF